jgi:hypothetical protein
MSTEFPYFYLPSAVSPLVSALLRLTLLPFVAMATLTFQHSGSFFYIFMHAALLITCYSSVHACSFVDHLLQLYSCIHAALLITCYSYIHTCSFVDQKLQLYLCMHAALLITCYSSVCARGFTRKSGSFECEVCPDDRINTA